MDEGLTRRLYRVGMGNNVEGKFPFRIVVLRGEIERDAAADLATVVGNVVGDTLDVPACDVIRHVLQKCADGDMSTSELCSYAHDLVVVPVLLSGVKVHNGRYEGVCKRIRTASAFDAATAIYSVDGGGVHRER
jgi:hypothetical protein